jgi:hypothetical protein
MPRNYSRSFQEKTNSTSADEAPLILLEISHADLVTPIRVVNDTQELIHNGDTFVAMEFGIVEPDDLEQGESRGAIEVDNVGRELTDWLEASNGGQGATVRIIEVLRSNPDVVEWEITMDLSDLHLDMRAVTGGLSFDDILNLTAVALVHRPDVSPGLF